jgi:polyferredoxin
LNKFGLARFACKIILISAFVSLPLKGVIRLCLIARKKLLLRDLQIVHNPDQGDKMPRTDGSVSASVLSMVLVGAFSGALAGLVLASVLANQVWLAIVTAFAAVAIALLVRRVVFGSPLRLLIPRQLELWQALVATLVGGLAGHELAIDLREPAVSPLIGATSGLIASILMATFVITVSSRKS